MVKQRQGEQCDMKNNVILLEEYKRNLTNKKKLDNGSITGEDLSLEELDGVSTLYVSEIRNLTREIEQTKKDIEILHQENSYLRNLVKDGDN